MRRKKFFRGPGVVRLALPGLLSALTSVTSAAEFAQVQCPELDEEHRAEVEARLRVEAMNAAQAGSLTVWCSDTKVEARLSSGPTGTSAPLSKLRNSSPLTEQLFRIGLEALGSPTIGSSAPDDDGPAVAAFPVETNQTSPESSSPAGESGDAPSGAPSDEPSLDASGSGRAVESSATVTDPRDGPSFFVAIALAFQLWDTEAVGTLGPELSLGLQDGSILGRGSGLGVRLSTAVLFPVGADDFRGTDVTPALLGRFALADWFVVETGPLVSILTLRPEGELSPGSRTSPRFGWDLGGELTLPLGWGRPYLRAGARFVGVERVARIDEVPLLHVPATQLSVALGYQSKR